MFFLILLAISSKTHAQEALRTTLETQTHNGYGRLVITLPELTKFVGYDVSSEDNVLVVRLDEPVELDLVAPSSTLSSYIRIARQDPNQRVLRFALNSGVRVNTMAAGEHLFLDFLPQTWRGELPSIPEDIVRKLEARAEEAIKVAEQNAFNAKEKDQKPRLDLRIGRHPTFSRFVFGWNIPYDASFKRERNIVSITFDKIGETESVTQAAAGELPTLVASLTTKQLESKTIIAMQVAPEAKVRSYFDNDEFVVDVTSEKLSRTQAGGSSLPFIIGGLPPLPEQSQNVTAAGEAQTERQLSDLPTREQILRQADNTRKDEPPKQSEEVVENQGPTVEPTRQAAEGSQFPNIEDVDENARQFPGLSTVRAASNENGDAVRIVFPFEKQTPAAIFRRSKSIWMVFKTEDKIDPTAIQALAGDFIRSVDLYDFDGYKAVRITVPSVQLASSAVEENNWVIAVGSTVIRATTALSVDRLIGKNGELFLSVPLDDAKGSVSFQDPTIGDHIHVVVADPPSRGLVRQQNFVHLQILPSSHALAFSTNNKDVFTKIGEKNVSITGGKGLSLSPTKNLKASQNGKFSTDEWYDLSFETAARTVSNPAVYQRRERELISAIAEDEEDSQGRKRLELAQFYAANGFAPEALAALQGALAHSPILGNKAAFVQTKAAAQVKLARYDDALKTLSVDRFKEDQDAAVWRTIAANELGKHDIVLDNASLGRLGLSRHDARIKQAFFLAASESALALNDLNSAKGYLSNIILSAAPEEHRGKYEMLQGELALVERRDEDARFFFERALESPNIEISADAKFRLIALDHKNALVPAKDTIEKLEQFVMNWRNDDIELKALRFLGEVLADQKEYRRAFKLVEAAVISNDTSPITYEIQNNMKEVFLDLFHKGHADELSTIDSLSLYYDFRDLMPIGRVGDEIVRYLASRLIDLDLLTQAAELLEHQVDQRLKGAARARIAADLAVVQLLDNKPHRAITTLRKSQTANLPASLRRQRLMIEAFSMAQNGKPDVALELLKPLSGLDVDRLRANINWDARRWLAAGRILEGMHNGRWSQQAPIEARERLDIMRAAIAFSLAEDDFALNRLNQKFGDKMSESSDAAVFEILVRPLDDQGFERDVTVDSILNIDSNDTFLEDYRRQFFGRTRAPSQA